MLVVILEAEGSHIIYSVIYVTRASDAVILLYSITSRESFDNVRGSYSQVYGVNGSKRRPVFLVGDIDELEAEL